MWRTKNTIREIIRDDGSALTDPKEIGDHLVAHYENFFKSGRTTRDAGLLSTIPSLVTELDNAMLTKIPSHDEIRFAVFYLDPTSAPGSDGYPGTFYRVCGDFIGRDVCRGIQSFFREGIVTKGVNCNFLCLIPKLENDNKVGQFHPLCLGNIFFKIIPKIMATRLSSILYKLISPEQGAFQKGRVIFENIGVASKLTNLMEVKCKGGGLDMKLDIQKAFDMLEWNFLFDVLNAFGFSQSWIHWVHQILQSTQISVLINGGPAGFFGTKRGLRQGDPLSSLLFIFSEEVLCRGLNELRHRGWLKALAGPRQVITPSHLLYADDLFIFMKAELVNVRRVKHFLEAYGEYSGQVINLAKSKVFFGRISAARRQRLLSVLQIPVCTFPTRGQLVKGDGSLKKAIGTSTLLPGLRRVWEFVQSAERWVVRNDNSIRFWYDKWLDNQSIEDLVHPLHIPRNQLASVADFWEGGNWALPAVQEPEIQSVFNKIQGSGITCHNGPDRRFWAHTTTGLFTVKSAWEALRLKAAIPNWVSAVWN
ncbi:uncharacterized protein LOC122644835 [Telopea speciosissima]|uniref:uncharacterized protein LOC122644835 n=1 Tax=Telopea speciosissima TaxID=54955 RepID=UPI001CC6E86D|nr:uncharacterized protein LOC122644835 [Telopea speciosissima]